MQRWYKSLRRKSIIYLVDQMEVCPPEVLSFSRNYVETVGFLDRFRDAALLPPARKHKVYVNLCGVKDISVPVAIVIAAEFDRWMRHRKIGLKVRDAHKWSPDLRFILSDLGVFDLLKIKNNYRYEKSTNSTFTITPLLSGLKVDGAKLNRLQTHFRETLEGLTNNPGLYEGLAEAVENAISHGYPEDYNPRHPFAGHRWWGAGCIDLDRMTLRFFVFDQGAGIPHTLPAAGFFENIRDYLSERFPGMITTDEMLLRGALETGRTRTRASHRGLGLKRMADVVEGTSDAYLRIISGRAELTYRSPNEISSSVHDESLGGTLIEWSLPADALTSNFASADANR